MRFHNKAMEGGFKPIPMMGSVTIMAVLLLLVFSLPARGENKSGVEPQVLSLPTGPGSVKGLGEAFEPDLNTGTAHYQVKIEAFPGVAGFTPDLQLSYNAGYGNGPLGLSWRLNAPLIQRQTDKGLPRYTERDVFVFDGSKELVPFENNMFRLKLEGAFMRFQKTSNGWVGWSKNGVRHQFGMTDGTRIADAAKGIFAWMIETSRDPHGNEIRYVYTKDRGACYLSEIRYGEINGGGARTISLTYEDRPDPVQDGKPRFSVTTAKRLKSISVLSQGKLVRKYVLTYSPAAGTSLSLLEKITLYGTDGTTALPSLSFDYTDFSTKGAGVTAMTDPPTATLSDTETDLVDMNGDSLPDLLHTPPSGHQVYLNLGNGAWNATAETPQVSPAHHLAQAGVFMGDLNGDGLSDLVVQNSMAFGFYRNTGSPWEKESDWVGYAAAPPFLLDDPDTRLVEINNDGLVDVVKTGSHSLTAYLNHAANPWTEVLENPGTGLLTANPQVQFADMNGDGLEDLVYLDTAGAIYYLMSLGLGNFVSEEYFITGSPVLSMAKIQEGRVLLMDVNGDGLTDLLQVDSTEITLWLNRGDQGFGQGLTLTGMPSFISGTPGLRQADMDGDGCKDLLYSFSNVPLNQAFQYVTFGSGTRPNLLQIVKNGLGMVIDIGYKSSTAYALSARDHGNPWTTRLPFPVTVVSGRRITDKLSGRAYVTDYVYRDGYYDGKEREFRGFAQVTEYLRGEASAPTLKTVHVFDVGKEEESRKGMLLEQARLAEAGTIDPPYCLFDRSTHLLSTRTVATGTNGETVRFSFTNQDDAFIHEWGETPKRLRTTRQVDNYGNTLRESVYGLIDGENLGFGNDELITTTAYEYRVSDGQWRLDLESRVTRTDLSEKVLADTRNTYNAAGDLTQQEKWESGTTWIPVLENAYDAWGNIIRITDANDHSRTLVYDPVFQTFPLSETIEDLGLSMTAAYDPVLGKMTSFRDPNGQKTLFGYDPLARLNYIVRPGDTEALPTQTFTYSLGDPLSRVGTFSREVSGKTGTYDVYTYYDGLGRKRQTRSEGENGKWVVSEAVSYNLRQLPGEKWLPYFDAASTYGAPDGTLPKTTLAYDPAGRSILETNPDGSFRKTEYRPLEQVKWDEEDNRTGGSHSDTPHTFTHDGLERLVQVTEKNGTETYTTRYGYDGLNNLVRILDDHGNLKTMTFDGLGRKIHMNDPDKGEMRYAYDKAGNLIQTTDNKGQTVSYAYDGANRILTENHNGVRVRYHYDADHPADTGLTPIQNTLGRLSHVEDEAGRIAFSYNARGNVIASARQVDAYEFMLGMNYDAMDRMTRLIYPDGETAAFRYNEMNRLENIPGYVNNIDYGPSGQKTAFQYPNGVRSAYTYDILQRLETLITQKSLKTLQHLSYVYDQVSNITAITDGRQSPTPESRTRTFQYDDLYRLTHCTAPTWHTAYGYDSIGNLTSKISSVADQKVNLGILAYGVGDAGPHAVTSAGPYSYTYDGNGNIKTKTGQTFTFDHKDRMTHTRRTADGSDAVYRYDYQGNRVSKQVTKNGNTETTLYIDRFAEIRGGQLIEHVFADDRRVADIRKPFNVGALIKDPKVLEINDFDTDHNNRISLQEIKSHGLDPNAFEMPEVRDALRIFRENLGQAAEYINFATIAPAVRGINPNAAPTEKTVHFYIPDHLGSASIMTDQQGNVLEESVYYPYGMNRARTGAFEAEYRFTGKELDGENDLHYFGARYYDAVVGRFVAVDTFYNRVRGIPDNTLATPYEIINSYCYGKSNPLNHIDSNGYNSKRYELAEEKNQKLSSEKKYEYQMKILTKSGKEFLKHTPRVLASLRRPLTSIAPYVRYSKNLKGALEVTGVLTVYENAKYNMAFYKPRSEKPAIQSAEITAEIAAIAMNSVNDIITGPGRVIGKLVSGSDSFDNEILDALDTKITGEDLMNQVFKPAGDWVGDKVFSFGERIGFF